MQFVTHRQIFFLYALFLDLSCKYIYNFNLKILGNSYFSSGFDDILVNILLDFVSSKFIWFQLLIPVIEQNYHFMTSICVRFYKNIK